jgi:hypothetical protein
MSNESEIRPWAKVRMPENVYEQISGLPDPETCKEIDRALHIRIVGLLESNGITILGSSYRVKDRSRIVEKIERKGSSRAINDIFGIRVIITEESDREKIGRIIQSAFPLTPALLPDGKKSVRDYRNPAVRSEHIENHNPHMSDRYSAMHVNFVFRRAGSDVYDIGEVQVMTKEELKIYKETRPFYPNGHKLLTGLS